MKTKLYLSILLCGLLGCNSNHIQSGEALTESDIKYIASLNLLGPDEKIHRFYSEFRKKNAGNFYTNKRIAKYWIDDRYTDRNQLFSAFYPEIKSIDTFYHPADTFCPYMLITKLNGTQFKVCADGKLEEIKSFFEGALRLWQQQRK